MPEWLRMPTPTMLTFAMLLSCTTPVELTSGTTACRTASVCFRSVSGTVNERSASWPCPLTLRTIMSTLMFAFARALKMPAAMPGRSGTLSIVTFACFLSAATPRTTMFSMAFTSSFTRVPGLSSKLDSTSSVTP